MSVVRIARPSPVPKTGFVEVADSRHHVVRCRKQCSACRCRPRSHTRRFQDAPCIARPALIFWSCASHRHVGGAGRLRSLRAWPCSRAASTWSRIISRSGPKQAYGTMANPRECSVRQPPPSSPDNVSVALYVRRRSSGRPRGWRPRARRPRGCTGTPRAAACGSCTRTAGCRPC